MSSFSFSASSLKCEDLVYIELATRVLQRRRVDRSVMEGGATVIIAVGSDNPLTLLCCSAMKVRLEVEKLAENGNSDLSLAIPCGPITPISTANQLADADGFKS